VLFAVVTLVLVLILAAIGSFLPNVIVATILARVGAGRGSGGRRPA
jgi:hypothetical protein